MSPVKAILTGVVGILLLASLIGYSGENVIDGVPKPVAGACGVTKESFSDVPGSGAFLDIDVDVSWTEDSVWVGVISVETYDSLDTTDVGNDDGQIVECSKVEKVDFLAGGPDSEDDSEFSWEPDGDEFHIVIGTSSSSPGGGILPAGDFQTSGFDVTVDYHASGGWGTIVILFIIEVGLIYITANDK